MAKQKEIEELEVVDFNAQDFVPEGATEVEETVSVSGGAENHDSEVIEDEASE